MTRAGLRDIAAALFLFAIAYAVWTFTSQLPQGTLRRMGPGFMPLLLASALAICGAVILVQGLLAARGTDSGDRPVPALDKQHLLNVVLVIGAIVLFAAGIRIFGLALTAFAVVVIAGQSSRDLTWKETLITAVLLSVFSVLLFKLALNLSMPIWPEFMAAFLP